VRRNSMRSERRLVTTDPWAFVEGVASADIIERIDPIFSGDAKIAAMTVLGP
jgi:hypothetical protein